MPLKSVSAFRLLLAAIVFSAVSRGAIPEFSAYIRIGDQSLFVLTDVESKSTSGWIPIGREFREYKILGFDATAEVVVVEHNAMSIRIPFKRSQVVAAQPQRDSTELKMLVSLDGKLLMNGREFPLETLDALLATFLSSKDARLRLVLQQPYYPPSADLSRVSATMKEVPMRMRASGFKRFEVIMAPPPDKP